MTEQDYNKDLAFSSNSEEHARVDGNEPWKGHFIDHQNNGYVSPSTKLEIAPNEACILHGHDPYPPNSIVFNAPPAKEIARFTEEGFYYKGEFVDDAGEVHRLLKDVLNGICYKQLCIELVNELEEWIAFGDEEGIIDAHALVDRARTTLND